MQLIFKEQSPIQLKKIRDKFYDLLVNCIDGQTILRELLQNFIKMEGMKQESIKEIIHQAAEHEKTLMCGSKAIYHLESFAAHAMEQIIIAKNNKMVIE
jgi:replication factor C subunit 3/5